MICLRCGYCCVQYDVIIVDDPNVGLQDSEVNLKHKPNGERCQHLTGDKCGEYACAIHDRPWYKKTPCYEYGQIERSPDTPCRMGAHLLKREKMKNERWVFTDAELASNGRDCSGDDELVARVMDVELGVLVERNGTVTNRWADGTAGVPDAVVKLAKDVESLQTTETPVELAENWRAVEVNDDGTLAWIIETV